LSQKLGREPGADRIGCRHGSRTIFERFKFSDQIDKLDPSNRLFTIVKAMADVDLHPNRIDNLQMGYLFEHLVMRFNEQANEEAGDHSCSGSH
jgi:type I restriction enzyme M protein